MNPTTIPLRSPPARIMSLVIDAISEAHPIVLSHDLRNSMAKPLLSHNRQSNRRSGLRPKCCVSFC